MTLTSEDVAILKQQILDLSATVRSLDERVEWFSAQLESHEYRIAELEQLKLSSAQRCRCSLRFV